MNALKSANTAVAIGRIAFHRIKNRINTDLLRNYVQKEMERTVRSSEKHLFWKRGEYSVIFSQGIDDAEVNCEIDLKFENGKTLFSSGIGRRANHAFNRAVTNLGSLSSDTFQLEFVA